MKDSADRNRLGIVVDTFKMPNPRREQPRSHGVIEEIWLGELLGILQRGGDERRIRHADACYQTGTQNLTPSVVNRLGHVPSLSPPKRSGDIPFVLLAEREQVAVDEIRMRGGEAVWQARIVDLHGS